MSAAESGLCPHPRLNVYPWLLVSAFVDSCWWMPMIDKILNAFCRDNKPCNNLVYVSRRGRLFFGVRPKPRKLLTRNRNVASSFPLIRDSSTAEPYLRGINDNT